MLKESEGSVHSRYVNNKKNSKDSYKPLEKEDKELKSKETKRKNKDEKKNQGETVKYEKLKSNLFKARIIDAEITSSLILQTIFYYNFFYAIMNFYIELTSVAYKMWIFKYEKILYIRIIFIVFSIFFEVYRLYIGYLANIQESFPNLLQTAVISFIFALPCHIAMIVTTHVSPLDWACAIISITFIVLEEVLIIRAIIRSINKQAAVFHLRNSATKTFTTEAQIRSSQDIEEELFFKHPELREKYSKAPSRYEESSYGDYESKKNA